jgi:hypothetical protein
MDRQVPERVFRPTQVRNGGDVPFGERENLFDRTVEALETPLLPRFFLGCDSSRPMTRRNSLAAESADDTSDNVTSALNNRAINNATRELSIRLAKSIQNGRFLLRSIG